MESRFQDKLLRAMETLLETRYLEAALRLFLATLAGSLIGLERSFHGRPAGLRTYSIVSLGSALLMLLTVFYAEIIPDSMGEKLNLDPTRMAQGIMTGIGFLGAGVIMRENLSIRGITTAASIWVAAAIGTVVGAGFYFEAILTTLVTLVILVLVSRVESYVPSLQYGILSVVMKGQKRFDEAIIYELIEKYGFVSKRVSFQMMNQGRYFRYEVTLSSRKKENFHKLLKNLSKMELVSEFHLTLTGE